MGAGQGCEGLAEEDKEQRKSAVIEQWVKRERRSCVKEKNRI